MCIRDSNKSDTCGSLRQWHYTGVSDADTLTSPPTPPSPANLNQHRNTSVLNKPDKCHPGGKRLHLIEQRPHPGTNNKKWGCTSGGVHPPCIDLCARWELINAFVCWLKVSFKTAVNTSAASFWDGNTKIWNRAVSFCDGNTKTWNRANGDWYSCCLHLAWKAMN